MLDETAFFHVSYGLYVVTAVDSSGKKFGCIANTFQQVASTPPTVSVALNKENATTRAILETGKYGVTVLSQDANMELIGTFGFRSSNDVDKYADIQHDLCESGIPYVKQAATAYFAVNVDQTVDVGTHVMLIGKVTEAKVLDQCEPMTYSYYHTALRGKTPPKAASYNAGNAGAATSISTSASQPTSQTTEQAEASTQVETPADPGSKKYAWRCTVCGHIEYVDELPDDFVCPICGVGKELFERIEI